MYVCVQERMSPIKYALHHDRDSGATELIKAAGGHMWAPHHDHMSKAAEGAVSTQLTAGGVFGILLLVAACEHFSRDLLCDSVGSVLLLTPFGAWKKYPLSS